METFSDLVALSAGNSPVTDEFPTQRPVTRSFDVFFDLGLNKRLSKQSRRWWLETPWLSVWYHGNDWLHVNTLSPEQMGRYLSDAFSNEFVIDSYHSDPDDIEMFVASYSVTYFIYVPGKPGICFHYYCAVYDECKYSDTFWLADRTRLLVQYTISLSSLCKLIWRHWTYKMPVRYILWSVWVRLRIFSPISIIQYVGLCVFSLPIPLVMIKRKYILCLIIIIKSEVWPITHCLVLGHETMVWAVCRSIF